MVAISSSELKHRVEVVKRFKELLKAQRDRFSAYLDTLDRQKDVIERGSADDLLHHVELEEKIVSDIFSIQKVIDPLEKMYHSARGDISPFAPIPVPGKQSDGEDVSCLKEALDGLKAEAIVRSERNRGLLTKRMTELRSEIKSLKSNPYAKGKNSIVAPIQIDIRG
ncbi:MAG: flagellar biosynthesis protein FlgN [Treponema sp.]|nr:flagellar biosynthesis protein FlgN [Treponema sp.]